MKPHETHSKTQKNNFFLKKTLKQLYINNITKYEQNSNGKTIRGDIINGKMDGKEDKF